MSTNKFFLYARKSTDAEDKQAYSIDHQLAELRQLAARKGLDVIAEYTENRSAKNPGRPAFNEMLTRIRKGEASGILAWHPDRLSRNSFDGTQIMDLVDQQLLLRMEFSIFWFEPTPQGKLILAIVLGMAKYQSDDLSQSIKRNHRQRIHDGHWPFQTPIGYLFDRNIRMIVLDPLKAPKVRKIFELYATGEYTLERLQQAGHQMGLVNSSTRYGGKPLTLNAYYYLLHNPIYTGILKYHGESFQGKHKPIISISVFEACQMILARKGKSRVQTLKPFLYRGMFTCGHCGGTITMEIQKGHTYLRCTKRNGPCSQPFMREEIVATQIAKAIQKVILPPSMIDPMIAELETKRTHELSAWKEEARIIKTKIAAFDLKIQRLIDVYVEGIRPLAEYRQSKEKFLKQKQLWVEKLTHVETHHESAIEPTLRFIRGLTEPSIIAEGNDFVRQRDFFQKIGSNLKLKAGRVRWEGRGAWKHVVELGDFARRPVNTRLAAASAHAPFQTGCPATSAIRTSPESFHRFFQEYPAWA